jgi:transposase InsO family protein
MIQIHREEFEVRLMCRLLSVSRSGYYAWCKRKPSLHKRTDARLRLEVRAAHRASRGYYGAPKVHRELQEKGVRCARKRVARLMQEEGLRSKIARKFRPQTTDSAHAHPIAPNTLGRRFDVEEIPGLDQRWAGDITYLPTAEGWLYLAVVLDLKSRRVVGWSMQTTLESELAQDALRMALQGRRPAPGLLHHSDRGVQYAAGDYRELLRRHDIEVSMSRRGNCWDNAVVESFFASLEKELITDADWQSRSQARANVFDWIEVWYNRRRRHSSLGYLCPAEYEARLALSPRAAA